MLFATMINPKYKNIVLLKCKDVNRQSKILLLKSWNSLNWRLFYNVGGLFKKILGGFSEKQADELKRKLFF